MNDNSQAVPVDVRRNFAATASAYRRIRRISKIAFALAIVVLLACAATQIAWLIGIFFALMVVGFIAAWSMPGLICPACSAKANLPVGPHCSECNGMFGARDRFGRSECGSCRKTLSWGKGGRHFKVRFCTYCGAFLDERGV
jgi:LSD1 subclass zinc finger protein